MTTQQHYRFDHAFAGELLDVACSVCTSRHADFVGLDNGYRVLRCRTPGCGFVYVNPRPTTEQLCELYERYYPEGEVAEETWDREMREIFTDCRRRLVALRERGTVLDVGCSYGHFLAGMVDAGWMGVGVEPSSTAARAAGSRTRARIIEGTFESADLAAGSFDAVVALYVLEHVSNPRAFLARVLDVLRAGGVAIVRVPYTEPLMPLNRLFGRPLMQAPMHLNDFSPHSLERLGKGVGFSRVEVTVGVTRRSSDRLERLGASLLGGAGRVLERLSGGRVLFRWAGAYTYLLWK